MAKTLHEALGKYSVTFSAMSSVTVGAISEALGVEKGETFEWEIQDRNTLTVKRIKPPKPKKKK